MITSVPGGLLDEKRAEWLTTGLRTGPSDRVAADAALGIPSVSDRPLTPEELTARAEACLASTAELLAASRRLIDA